LLAGQEHGRTIPLAEVINAACVRFVRQWRSRRP
jgi:hypothetical protein